MLRSPIQSVRFALAAVLLATAASGHAADKTLRFAHIYSPEHSSHKAAVQLSDVVKQQTGGGVDVRVLPSGQLGQERQIMEGLMVGSIDIANVAGNVVQGFEAAAGLTSLPYLVRDFNHAFRIEDGEVGKEIEKRILAKTGVRVIGYNTTGFREVVSPGKPIVSLADFKGLKIRVPESPLMVATFKALGANPTPIPWGELYTALQTKVVDACESPPGALNDIKIFEIAKSMSLTNHVYTGTLVLMSEKAFQRLTEKERQAILDAGRQMTKSQREQAVKDQNATIESLQKNAGVKVHPVDTAPLQKAVTPVYQDYGKTIGGMTLIDSILKL